MKIGLFVHKIHQFEPDTGKNTQDRCENHIENEPQEIKSQIGYST